MQGGGGAARPDPVPRLGARAKDTPAARSVVYILHNMFGTYLADFSLSAGSFPIC